MASKIYLVENDPAAIYRCQLKAVSIATKHHELVAIYRACINCFGPGLLTAQISTACKMRLVELQDPEALARYGGK